MTVLKKFLDTVYQSQRAGSAMLGKSILTLLMACLGYGYAQFLRVWSSFDLTFLAFFCFLISAEALYTHAKVKTMEGREKTIFRASEILSILILYKIYILLLSGPVWILQEVSAWQTDFLSSFFTPPYLIGIFIFIPVWVITNTLAGLIDELHEREEDATWDELGKVQNALHYIRGRIAGFVFGMGGLILFFAVGARLNFREYVPVLQGKYNPGIPVINVLLYFVLALILLSQTQFALLRTRWLWNKTPVAPHLGRRWAWYAAGFFGALALLVFFLPTDYSMGFFETLAYALNVLGIILRFILGLVMLPLAFCMQLLNLRVNSSQNTSPPADLQPLPPQPGASPDPFWQFLQSLLFWGLLVAVVIFALGQYFKANRALWTRILRFPLIHWLSIGLGKVWRWLVGANKILVSAVTAGIKRLRPANPALRSAERRIRKPGGLNAREQVIQLYLTLLALAEDQGKGRSESQTPYQYSQELITADPEVTSDLLDVTDAFVEARYSRHAIESARVPTLRTTWERLRAYLLRK